MMKPLVQNRLRGGRARGIALVTSLLILVMLTLLALAMFHSFGLQQKIAGNVFEKERAFQTAESAVQFGEHWLTQGSPESQGTGVDCTVAATGLRVCTDALNDARSPLAWPTTYDYLPPALQVASGGGVTTDANGNSDINYSKVPGLYIAYLGISANGRETLYSVTTAGYGGTVDTSAVLQSVYATRPRVQSLDGP